MSAKEVTALRKKGELLEAFNLAKKLLEEDAENIWNKRASAWVYYEYLKSYNETQQDPKHFIEMLQNIKALNLPEEETMLFDNVLWQVGKYVFFLQQNFVKNQSFINNIFEAIKEFHFTKPSEGYSFLLKAFQKNAKIWSQYVAFVDWWGFENFQPEDMKDSMFDGRAIMALAEQVYTVYSKKLVTGVLLDEFGQTVQIDKAKITSFLPRLKTVIQTHPTYEFLPYYEAKMLILLGDKEDALQVFLPFAKQKRSQVWVWQLLAESFAKDEETKIAYLCKALSLKTKEPFLLNVRNELAKSLIAKGSFDNAKTEIEKIVAVRTKNNWKIPNYVQQWQQQDWYKKAQHFDSNFPFYKKYIKSAEAILFSDIEEELIVVDFVNQDRKMLNFVLSEQKYGFFKYDRFIKNPKIGDVYKVRFLESTNEGFCKVATLNATKESNHLIKIVSGNIRIRDNQKFGFVEDVFVPPHLISENKLTNHSSIALEAMLSYNKSKNQAGWKAIKISHF